MSNAEDAICLNSDYDDQSHTLIGDRRGQEDYERSRACSSIGVDGLG